MSSEPPDILFTPTPSLFAERPVQPLSAERPVQPLSTEPPVQPLSTEPPATQPLSAERPGQLRAGACPLGICDGSGFVIDESTNTASDCRCRPGRIARVRASSLAGRVPRKYRGVSFERPPVSDIARVAPHQVQQIRSYVHQIEENLNVGRGLWLWGDVGTGKTTLAMLVSQAALQAGRSVVIHSLPRLLNLIRNAIETEAGMVGFLERLTAVDLLHIDDLGAENTTDWVLEQLYSIINTRYEDERAMIVTTNLKFEELMEQLGERTVSRLVAICGEPLPLYGEDKRRELPPPARSA